MTADLRISGTVPKIINGSRMHRSMSEWAVMCACHETASPSEFPPRDTGPRHRDPGDEQLADLSVTLSCLEISYRLGNDDDLSPAGSIPTENWGCVSGRQCYMVELLVAGVTVEPTPLGPLERLHSHIRYVR